MNWVELERFQFGRVTFYLWHMKNNLWSMVDLPVGKFSKPPVIRWEHISGDTQVLAAIINKENRQSSKMKLPYQDSRHPLSKKAKTNSKVQSFWKHILCSMSERLNNYWYTLNWMKLSIAQQCLKLDCSQAAYGFFWQSRWYSDSLAFRAINSLTSWLFWTSW